MVEGGCGLDCVPQEKVLKSQPPETVDMTKSCHFEEFTVFLLFNSGINKGYKEDS